MLLGYKRSGKTTVGNIILREKAFPSRETLESMQHCGRVAGRAVVVVDTPGWHWDFVSEKTPELDWQIIRSVQRLCSEAAPFVFLLFVRAAFSFKEDNKCITEEYLQLLGECVWNHTIVVFTTGGWMEDVNIEQHIESEGKSLQWLVDKCGSRYHVFDTTGRKEDVQVPELMIKMEQVVANNKDCHLHLDQEICGSVERKYFIASNQASQMTLEESRKHNSMLISPPDRRFKFLYCFIFFLLKKTNTDIQCTAAFSLS